MSIGEAKSPMGAESELMLFFPLVCCEAHQGFFYQDFPTKRRKMQKITPSGVKAVIDIIAD